MHLVIGAPPGGIHAGSYIQGEPAGAVHHQAGHADVAHEWSGPHGLRDWEGREHVVAPDVRHLLAIPICLGLLFTVVPCTGHSGTRWWGWGFEV